MKLRRDDTVMIIAGKDRGQTGKVVAVLPTTRQVVVENRNLVKRHTKPDSKHPRGGILEIAKPIDASKVMVVDPASGQPARVGFKLLPNGSKERIFKVSPQRRGTNKAKAASAAKATKTKGDES